MKKIFTLLFAVGMVTIASAQSGRFEHGKQAAGYASNTKVTLHQINREYDYKIAAVRMDRHLRSWEKAKQIQFLQKQRDAAIRNMQFNFEKDSRFYGSNGNRRSNAHKW
ncbi:MAG: hypothetical protein ABIU63_05460 [Chitinophagaceae bacterium]